MRTIEEIRNSLNRWRNELEWRENRMDVALQKHCEFAYNLHKAEFDKAKYYIEILEYVLGERE